MVDERMLNADQTKDNHVRQTHASTSLAAAAAPAAALRRVRFQIDGEVLASSASSTSDPRCAPTSKTERLEPTPPPCHDYAALCELASRRAADMACLASDLGFQVVSPPLCLPPLPAATSAPAALAAAEPSTLQAPCLPLNCDLVTSVGLIAGVMNGDSSLTSNDASLLSSPLVEDPGHGVVLFPVTAVGNDDGDRPECDGDPPIDVIHLSMPTVEIFSEDSRRESTSVGSPSEPHHFSPVQTIPPNNWGSLPAPPRLGLEAAVNHSITAHRVPDSNGTNANDSHNANNSAVLSPNHPATVAPALNRSVNLLVDSEEQQRPSRSPGASNSEGNAYPLPDIVIAINTRAPSRSSSSNVTTVMSTTGEFDWSSSSLHAAHTRDPLRRPSPPPRVAGTWWPQTAPPPPPPPPLPHVLTPPQRTPLNARLSGQRFSTSWRDVPSPPVFSFSGADAAPSSLVNLCSPVETSLSDVQPLLLVREVSSADASCSFGFSGLSALEPHALETV